MIFVFGSNLAGRHGKGAALTAKKTYGAVHGVGRGPTGQAYAIPTKDAKLHVLPLNQIELYVKEFCDYARQHPGVRFKVTRIGCGLAGYSEDQIKGMFAGSPENCIMPEGWGG